jgi:hypothetical protein
MSYHVFFAFSTGLKKAIKVPKGTLAKITQQIADTERICGLTRTPAYTPEGEKQRPGWHWTGAEKAMRAKAGPEIDSSLPNWWLDDRARDERIGAMSTAVINHNGFVRNLYEDLGKWWEVTKWKRGSSETITSRQAEEFWGGLRILELPRVLWTRDHFVDRMAHLYSLLSTGESEGVTLNCSAFNATQTAALIDIFEGELDQWGFDCRFAVPLDENLQPYDQLVTSYDGGYDWCSYCGPIHSDDFFARCRVCPRAKEGKCELKNNHPAEFEDEEKEEE